MRFRGFRKKGSRGFTLLELMIVISIMLILVSVGVPLYQSSVRKASSSSMDWGQN